ncbi:unnamed protein product [Schistosoma curassoni]|uniref:Protein kinase domain-containing protein n=1 Tax=Schistosoma curassoni TaxID=6186 RepID=A0A183K5M8_9TREM|nr:unnamed protein product [Schistosoma curassoni]VDP39281.1 unnamed protein product [Schistosoma curassoni]
MSPTAKLKRTFSLLVGSDITIKFLLPNGIIIPLTVNSESTLEEIKVQLWISAAKLPLFDILQSKNDYIFVGVNRETGDEEEFYDINRRLHEIPLLLPYLRVTEIARDTTLLKISNQNAAISSCTGIPHTDIIRACRTNPEVKWARLRLLRVANMHTKALNQTGSDGLIRYLTSASKRELSQSLKVLLQKQTHLTITAWVLDGKDPPEKCRVVLELDKKATVFNALNEILHAQAELARQDCQVKMSYGLPDASNYLLKVCCSQAYLFDLNELLIQYEYIQQSIEHHQHPCLSPILKNDIKQSLHNCLNEYNKNPIYQLNHNNDSSIISSKSTLNTYTNNFDKNNNNSIDLYQQLENFLINHDKFDKCETDECISNIDDNFIDCRSSIDFNKDDDTSAFDVIDSAHTVLLSENCSSKNAEGIQKNLTSPFTLTSDRQQNVSLWELSGFLSIQVCSAQFLVENITSLNSSSTTSLSLSTISFPSSSVHQSNPNLNVVQHTSVHGGAALDGSYVVRVGIFHGSQFLIECQTTKERPGNYLTWREWLNFHILLADLPIATRICVALIRIRKIVDRKNVRFCEYLYGWGNVNLFDHNGFMITGEITLNLWPPSLVQTADESLHPCGTVLGNPNPEFSIQIKIHNPTQGRIRRPTVNCFINAYHTKKFNSSSSQSYSDSHSLKSRNDDHAKSAKVDYSFCTSEIGDVDACLCIESNNNLTTIHNNTYKGDIPLEFVSNKSFQNNTITSSVTNLTNKILESRLREIVNRDPLYELCEQEKDYLWRGRYWCLNNLPSALPWICQVVNWCGRDTLAEFYTLIHQWPQPFSVDIALRLLGAFDLTRSNSNLIDLPNGIKVGASGIADLYIRELAVNSLYNLSDAELSDYLLQLVQALKAETYLDNALTRFILYRALKNPLQIGLRLFWHLRSELHLPDIRLRFSLILEAFCRGCGPMLVLLSRQVTALNRLEALSTRLKELTSEDEQRELFREEMSRTETQHDLQWLPSPLCLSEILGELLIHKCDVKRSKKRPLWLVWTNPDRLAQFHHQNYQLIFKHGDDLRQDMLTLQLLKLMDRIWKEEGMDMCLTSYGCFATGYEMGIIEAVRDSRTVMSIQGERLRSALQIDSSQLYKWLMQHAKQKARQLNHSPLGDNSAYERMIRTFTMSCAGYCVATFILGIRDRHPDNIMVDSTGRLFHIDFGHILDNRKKKFGFTRERVPFVLTKDFITVIARGNSDAGTISTTTNTPPSVIHNTIGGIYGNMYFQEFTDLCGKAYLLLRKHSNLILTLLAMMLPSGLPELTSVCDLEHVRKTLAVEIDNEQEALAYFHHKFNEAYSGAWTTKIDWFSHWMNT